MTSVGTVQVQTKLGKSIGRDKVLPPKNVPSNFRPKEANELIGNTGGSIFEIFISIQTWPSLKGLNSTHSPFFHPLKLPGYPFLSFSEFWKTDIKEGFQIIAFPTWINLTCVPPKSKVRPSAYPQIRIVPPMRTPKPQLFPPLLTQIIYFWVFKAFAYTLWTACVPLWVRVPQVENRWSRLLSLFFHPITSRVERVTTHFWRNCFRTNDLSEIGRDHFVDRCLICVEAIMQSHSGESKQSNLSKTS